MFFPLFILIKLQPQLLSGKNGASGPNAQPLVVLVLQLGPVHATIQLLKAMSSVLEIPQRLEIAQQQSVKVVAFATDWNANI